MGEDRLFPWTTSWSQVGRLRWHLWPEHLRTLTHPPNVSALAEKKEKPARWVIGLAPVENKREERSTLVAGIPLVTLNSSWEILLLETSALNLCPPSL